MASYGGKGRVLVLEGYLATTRPWLLRVATVLSGDGALAEDLVQAVLTKVFRQWERVRLADSPDAYVRRMLVNEYVSWRRVGWRTSAVAHLEDLMPPAGDPAERYVEQVVLLSQVLRLPRKQRAAVVLRYYEGLSDEEIAYALNCTPTTVRSNISRALASLRVALAGPDTDETEADYELHRG